MKNTSRSKKVVSIFASNSAAMVALPTPEDEFDSVVTVGLEAAKQYFSVKNYSACVSKLCVLDIAGGLLHVSAKSDGSYKLIPSEEMKYTLQERHAAMAGELDARSSAEADMLQDYLASLEDAPNGLNTEDAVLNPLQWLLHAAPNGIYILAGWAAYMSGETANPEAIRLLSTISARFKSDAAALKKKVIITAPSLSLPADLAAVPIINYELPTEGELIAKVKSLIAIAKKAFKSVEKPLSVVLDENDFTELGRRAKGLTLGEVESVTRVHVFGRSVSKEDGSDTIDGLLIDELVSAKMNKLKALGVDFAESPDVSPKGMDLLVSWADRQKQIYWRDEQASKLNLSMAGAALLVGPPGTGKTLMAKTLGASWGLPVLALNLGSLYGSLVGSTEAKTQEVFRLVAQCGRCIVLLDEIDKEAGALDGGGDAGTSKRLFKTLLSWLSDKPEGVFAILTANDPRSILKSMPELFRDGRVGKVFFADLPSSAGRADILAVHLERVQPEGDRLPESDLLSLSTATDRMTGAELAAAVNSAAEIAFFQGTDVITLDHLKQALAGSKKMADFSGTNISEIRQWAAQHAQPVHSGDRVKAARKKQPQSSAESDVVLG